ncbi:hypothetical protein ACFQS6_15555 [Xanthomonas populi]|uniref:Uncharacterized protein n=1 Tax=Xanthomonas populi TaxID=53414 RepID=A0A2S7ETF4_9XANT|nr:hypothetical protein [Xanthomonas populi]PPU96401.1 hypothetical protein XpopCFBP1817_06800 [Xanthomonas populi]
MIVVGHAPADWFLLRDGDLDWLDVKCNVSFTGFPVLLALNATGQADVVADGHAACARPAAQVHWQPRDFVMRDVSASHGACVTTVVQARQAANTAAA